MINHMITSAGLTIAEMLKMQLTPHVRMELNFTQSASMHMCFLSFW